MRQWLSDRPWIWIVAFFVVLFAATAWTLILAQLNRPVVL